MFASSELVPVVDIVLSVSELVRAHEMVDKRTHFGQVILVTYEQQQCHRLRMTVAVDSRNDYQEGETMKSTLKRWRAQAQHFRASPAVFLSAVASAAWIFGSQALAVDPITDKPWRERVLSVTDPDVTARFFKEIGGYEALGAVACRPPRLRRGA